MQSTKAALQQTSGLKSAKKDDSYEWSWRSMEINWISTIIIFVPPLGVLAAICLGLPFQFNTLMVGLVFYAFGGFGITMGYHRLHSHRAYSAHPILDLVLSVMGAGAFQGSIKWWARNHRAHHRYIDTNKDPYNAKRGFWWSHLGWMIFKQNYEELGHADISDLTSNKIVMWQHKHYLKLAIFSGIILPTLICGIFWGDWMGGYFYAAFLKIFTLHHTTFFINSLAHSPLIGAQNFSKEHTSHDSWICALLTFGEGYHNFHHEFAQDYRNGIKWYHWDPAKWMIRLSEIVGLASRLVRIPNDVIQKNLFEIKHQEHAEAAEQFSQKLEELDSKTLVDESWDWSKINKLVGEGRKLIVLGGIVLDLEKCIPTGAGYTHKCKNINWYQAHPGGQKILDMFIGKDATSAFAGGIYKHSVGARNLVNHLRVAKVRLTD